MRSQNNPDDMFVINNPEHHDIKYFAMLNNSVAVTGTPFEGGNDVAAATYYNYLLNLNSPNSPVNFNLDVNQMEAIQNAITGLQQIQTFLFMQSVREKNLRNDENELDSLIKLISDNSNNKFGSYFPSGWTGDPGHFAVLKFRRLENNRYAVSVINKGAGMRFHQKISKRGYKERNSYQSEEYEIDLGSSGGRQCLRQLAEIKLNPSEDQKLNKYSEFDLYGILKLHGKEIPLPKETLAKKAVSSQRSGTCTVTNTDAIASDIMVEMNVDVKSRKQYHFVMKLRSIIAAYDEYKNGNCPYEVMDWALREFAVRLNKTYNNVLTDQQIIACSELHNTIREHLNRDNQDRIEKKISISAVPENNEGKAPEFKKFRTDIDIQKEREFWGKITEKSKKKISPAKETIGKSDKKITPDNVLQLLEYKTFDLESMYALLNSLPSCSGENKDPFWDKVPEDHIARIISQFNKIITDAESTAQHGSIDLKQRSRLSVMSLIGYDIAAQLMQRSNTLNPGNKYALALDDVYSKQIYTDPVAYHTVKRIARNFENRCKNKERIFSNSVNYDSGKFDKTIDYVINVILTETDRQKITRKLNERGLGEQVKYRDIDLFRYLMTGHLEELLSEDLRKIIKLSGLAHSPSGKYHVRSKSTTYEYINDKTLFCFDKNEFTNELGRESNLTKLNIAKRLPKVKADEKAFKDYSENTIYDSRQTTGERNTNAAFEPWQTFLSGSISTDSNVWKPNKKELINYELMDEDLRRFECSPNLQISRVFAWASNNPHKLNNPDFRSGIHELIFQYGKLDNAFVNQRESALSNMNKLLDSLLTYLEDEGKNDIDLLIWSATLAQDLRYHLEVSAKIYDFSIDEVQLPSFRSALFEATMIVDKEKRSEIENTLIRDYQHETVEEIKNLHGPLLIYRMLANLAEHPLGGDEAWNTIKGTIIESLGEDGEYLSEEMNQMLAEFLNSQNDLRWKREGKELVAKNTDLYVDLESGSLKQRGVKALKDYTKKSIAHNKELFTRLNLSETNVVLLGNDELHVKSSDGKWSFDITYEGKIPSFKIFQKLVLEGKTSSYRMLDKSELDKFSVTHELENENPFESSSSLNTYYQYWQDSTDNKSLFILQDNSEFAYHYSIDTGVISQLEQDENSEWKRNGKTLLNLTEGFALHKLIEQTYNEVFNDRTKKVPREIITLSYEKELEIKWASHLQPLFGLKNIRCIAALSEDKKTCRVERIEHAALGLNFNLDKQGRLNSEEFPDYFLSEKSGMEELQGYSGIIKLENNSGEKKYILPAYRFNAGEKNNALNSDPASIIFHGALCNPSQPWYSMTLNKNNELVGDSVEANLYLAILYRSLGDYQRAFHCLERCQSSKNITPETFAIAMQVLNRKIKSPLGAAFDLKLACFLNEHQTKWTSQKSEKIKFPDHWQSWIDGQLDFYKKTFSSYKVGVAIIPEYARLDEADFKWLGESAEDKKIDLAILKLKSWELDQYGNSDFNRLARENHVEIIVINIDDQFMLYKSSMGYKDKLIDLEPEPFSHLIFPKNRGTKVLRKKNVSDEMMKEITKNAFEDQQKKLQDFDPRSAKVNHLPESALMNWRSMNSDIDELKHELKNYPEKYLSDAKEFISPNETWRISSSKSEWPGFNYLLVNFKDLYNEAISDDPERVKQLRILLFRILQNDSYEKQEGKKDVSGFVIQYTDLLVYMLNCVSNHPQYFRDIDIRGDKFKLMSKIKDVIFKHDQELVKERIYLIDPIPPSGEITMEPSPYADHVPESVNFSIAPIKRKKGLKHPLVSILSKSLDEEVVPVASNEFALDISGLPTASKIEKRLLNQYQKGHEENKNKKTKLYSLKNDVTLDEFRSDLDAIKLKDQASINKIERKLIKLANQLPLEQASAYNLLMARASEQRHEITISDLFTSFLQKNPNLLTQQNPFLTQNDIEIIYSKLADYALLQSRVDQSNQILDDLKDKNNLNELSAYERQELGEKLDKQREYEIEEFPEFLVYEYATKRILRKDQVDILNKIITLIESKSERSEEMHHALLQFAAGGGKTSVLIPILAQRFASKGFLPVIFNTNELYQTGLEDIPKNLRASFQQNLEVVERELDHEWKENELIQLLTDLERWKEQKKCVLLKPVTWHSINIAYKKALIAAGDMELRKDRDKNSAIADAAKEVMNYFHKNAVKLEDESHIVSDPLQQSIKTSGKSVPVPESQLALLMTCYDHLMGHAKDSDAIANLAQMKFKRERPIRDDELAELQERLAKVMISQPEFKDFNHKELLAYLLQKDKKRPEWLINLHDKDKQSADLVIIARAFLNTHLPHILTLEHKKDYGTSMHAGDLTAAPKHEQKDVSSHFGDPMLVSALTMQMYHQQGLSPAQAEQVLEVVLNQHREERKWNTDLDVPTAAERWLLQLIPEKYEFHSYRDLTTELKTNLSMDSGFFKNPEVIKKFLNEFALRQIRIPQTRITSTPAEMQAGFKYSVYFSATPGLKEIYPVFLKLKNCFLEEAFETQVIDTLLQVKKDGIITLDKTTNPEDFFSQFPPEQLATITTLIDRGALLSDFDAEEVIKSYLNLDKEKYQTATQTAAFFSEKQLHLKSKDKKVKEVDIKGTALVQALKDQNIKPESFLLFLFLDLSKTTGIDIKRPSMDRAALTVGKGQTVTNTIQGAMRERQLLYKNAQTVTWTMFNALYNEIYPDVPLNQFDPVKLLYWMIGNEAESLKIKLINRAYQGIDQVFNELILQKGEDYTRYLNQSLSASAWNNYELDSTERDTAKVLEEYVKNKFKVEIFQGYYPREIQLKIPEEAQDRINTIIKETAALIDQLPESSQKNQLNDKVEQEMEMVSTETKKMEEQQRIFINQNISEDSVFAVESYSVETDNLKNIFDKKSQENYHSLLLPGCDSIRQPEFIYNPGNFSVTENANKKILTQLKPIDTMLVKILPDKSMEYLACTDASLEYFSCMMTNNKLTTEFPAYALVTTSGNILHTSNNISLAQCEAFISTEDCQRRLTYANFLNGKITNPLMLAEIVKEQGWSQKDYATLVDAIKKIHVSRHPVNLLDNSTLEDLCGWEKKKADIKITTTIHKRYRKPEARDKEERIRISLHPANDFPSKNDIILLPVSQPAHALDGYLLGETPSPVSSLSYVEIVNKPVIEIKEEIIQQEIIKEEKPTIEIGKKQPELAVAMSKFVIPNISNIPEKDSAILNLLNEANIILIDANLTDADKLQILEDKYQEFSTFDKALESLYAKLQNNNEPQYQNLQNLAVKFIGFAYSQLASGETINVCNYELQKSLANLHSEAQKKSKQESSFFFKSSPQIIPIIEKSFKELQSLSQQYTSKSLK